MTADVTQDRRVTVPTRGTPTAFVDWSRLFWTLPSHVVHEGLGYRGFRNEWILSDRIQGDAIFSHASIKAQSRITSCRRVSDRASLHHHNGARIEKLGFQGMQKSIVMQQLLIDQADNNNADEQHPPALSHHYEFLTGYSLAGCSPAEPASASPARIF